VQKRDHLKQIIMFSLLFSELSAAHQSFCMTTLRSFIKQSALASAGILLAQSSYSNIFPGKKPKVIIIGAGFAGLSAALYLDKRM
jgi:hypothetical protein